MGRARNSAHKGQRGSQDAARALNVAAALSGVLDRSAKWRPQAAQERASAVTVGWNGRRYVATVVGIPGYRDEGHNSTRHEAFVKAWQQAWPQLKIRTQASFYNDPSLRGLGCLVGHYMGLHHLFANLGGQFDFALMLEDDALPFPGATWPGAGGPNHLDKRLNDLRRARGSGLVLGGHHFRGWNMSDVRPLLASPLGGIVHATHAWGSFAYVLTRPAAYAVYRHFRVHIHAATPSSRLLGPDDLLWNKLEMIREKHGGAGGGFVSTPLLVDHARGTSETWRRVKNKKMARLWEGSEAWWNFSKPLR